MNKQIFLASLIAILLLSSCASRKDFVYLKDMETGKKYPFSEKYEAVVHCDDRLDITVSSKNPELAIPFNIYGGTFKVGNDGSVTADATTRVNEKGYRVDVDGNIDFPILGKLHVEGLTVGEVTELIKRRIEAGNYMKDPLVSIEFLNFRYTVLGEVGRNGTFSVNGDRITLLEAIANAGEPRPGLTGWLSYGKSTGKGRCICTICGASMFSSRHASICSRTTSYMWSPNIRRKTVRTGDGRL